MPLICLKERFLVSNETFKIGKKMERTEKKVTY